MVRAGSPIRILGVVNTSWQIDGTGDFNGTGEVIFYGATPMAPPEIWNAKGSGGFTYENLGVVNTSWQIAGTGDFTGTGRSQHLMAQHQRRHRAVESQRLGRLRLAKNLGIVEHQLADCRNRRFHR